MPNQSTASISPINLMVLSAGRVSLPKMKPLRSIVATVHDLSGSTVKPDYDFWRFAQFLHAATPRLSTRRGLRLNVTGKIRTREAFVGSLDRVATQKPELLVWWTFSPPLLPGKVSVAEIAERLFSVCQGGTAVIYPSTTGINALGPGMFAVGGVRADGGRLHSSVPPPGWIEVVPNVVTWNAWDRFREGWLGFGVPPAALPEQYPLETTHTIPVWTITAALLLFCGAFGPSLSNERLQTNLKHCTVPVTISRLSEEIATRFFDIMYFACFDELLLVQAERDAGR
jgi:hypothetical protein